MIKCRYSKGGSLYRDQIAWSSFYYAGFNPTHQAYGYIGFMVDPDKIVSEENIRNDYMTDGTAERQLRSTQFIIGPKVHHLNSILHLKFEGTVDSPNLLFWLHSLYSHTWYDLEDGSLEAYNHLCLLKPGGDSSWYGDWFPTYDRVNHQVATERFWTRCKSFKLSYDCLDISRLIVHECRLSRTIRYEIRVAHFVIKQYDDVWHGLSKVHGPSGDFDPRAGRISNVQRWTGEVQPDQFGPILKQAEAEFQAICPMFTSIISHSSWTKRSCAKEDFTSAMAVVRNLNPLDYVYGDELLKPKVNWNNLAYKAYQDIGFWNGNGIAFVRDAIHLRDDFLGTAHELSSLVHKLKRAGKSKYIAREVSRRAKFVARSTALADALSSLYLSFHYGYKLTVQDSLELANQAPKLAEFMPLKRVSAMETTSENGVEGVARYHCYYDPTPLGALDQALTELDLKLTLENAWDMVPYSFVIDWFTKLGDYFNAIDNYAQVSQKYHVYAICRSWKASKVVEVEIPTSGGSTYDLKLVSYQRWADKEPLKPLPPTDVSINPFSHIAEATALIVQKIL